MPRTPWYLEPRALDILADLRANPPVHQPNTSTNKLCSNAAHTGPAADELRALFEVAWSQVDRSNRDACVALMNTSADEVLAGLFGCPNDLDWAHPDRAARRAQLAVEIDAALGVGVAA